MFGQTSGTVSLTYNLGTPSAPDFPLTGGAGDGMSLDPFSEVEAGFSKLVYAVPMFHDVDSDGDSDLVIGGRYGLMYEYRNTALEQFCFFNGAFDINAMRCLCDTGYSGAQCYSQCPGLKERQPVCYGHGACYSQGDLTNNCLCETGWNGTEVLASGSFGIDGQRTTSPTAFQSCSGCSNPPATVASGVQREPAYFSSVCALCPGSGTCNGRGSCGAGLYGNGMCTCDAGYDGSSCQIFLGCGAGIGYNGDDDNGAVKCEACKPGRYTADGKAACTLCKVGSYSPANAGVCTEVYTRDAWRMLAHACVYRRHV